MQIYQMLAFLRRWMQALNAVVMLFVFGILLITPHIVIASAQSLRFAQGLSWIVYKPWVTWGGLLLAVLLFVLSDSSRALPNSMLGRNSPFIYFIEPLLCIWVLIALQFGYNGLLLYVVVDLVDPLH